MPTGNDIVTAAFKKAGILGLGQTLAADDVNDGLSDLNDMLAQWRRQRWMVYHLLDLSFTADGRTTPYTIGPTGNFVISPRPARIESGFIRQIVSGSLNVDFPNLRILPSWEDYSRVAVKALVSLPWAVFLDTAYPTGNVYFYPWPQSGIYESHLQVMDTLASITLAASYTLPAEYDAAMKFNLARRLRQAYGKGKSPDVELNAMADAALNVIINANVQVPLMRMPRALKRRGNAYNIYTDNLGPY